MHKHVLVIDDDQGISEVVKIILTENGYTVDVISDGNNLVERIKKINPNVVLLDIWMSGVDGRDVLKAIREDKTISKMPVIVISALTNTDKIAEEAKADDFLPKPFDISDLLMKVEQFTGEKGKS